MIISLIQKTRLDLYVQFVFLYYNKKIVDRRFRLKEKIYCLAYMLTTALQLLLQKKKSPRSLFVVFWGHKSIQTLFLYMVTIWIIGHLSCKVIAWISNFLSSQFYMYSYLLFASFTLKYIISFYKTKITAREDLCNECKWGILVCSCCVVFTHFLPCYLQNMKYLAEHGTQSDKLSSRAG